MKQNTVEKLRRRLRLLSDRLFFVFDSYLDVKADTQFHIASVRKSYIGFYAAYAVHNGYFSIDDPITRFVEDSYLPAYEGVTIRHLLTHTHGLIIADGKLVSEYKPGESWAYRGPSIELLTTIIKKTTGQSVADIVKEHVIEPVVFEVEDPTILDFAFASEPIVLITIESVYSFKYPMII
ncbi:serine hydrolase domain-containing protein [Oceanobacillus sp. M65]|uniref:serine hydrolase domain-containing protein n=1 Tax=Oceanobacillus sp. M65 TaxID=3457435 RepID=UPI003FCE4DED